MVKNFNTAKLNIFKILFYYLPFLLSDKFLFILSFSWLIKHGEEFYRFFHKKDKKFSSRWVNTRMKFYLILGHKQKCGETKIGDFFRIIGQNTHLTISF